MLGLIVFILTLSSGNSYANQSCISNLTQDEVASVFGDYSFISPKPYLIGSDNLSQEEQKAEFIHYALKEQFPHLQIYVEPKALPKKLDVFAVLDFFYLNQIIIKRIFESYSSGEIIFTNYSSIGVYSDQQSNILQLRMQVSNQFGSALRNPFARIQPLARNELVNQWRTFLSITTPVSPKFIK